MGADKVANVGMLLLYVIIAAMVVFLVGILVEFLRTLLMKGLHQGLMHIGLYRRLMDRIAAVDAFMKGKS